MYTKKIFYLLLFLLLIYTLANKLNLVYAVGNYNISNSTQVQISDWNLLDDDFLSRQDGVMNGDLNLNSNKIISGNTNSASSSDLANVNYVNSEVSGRLGGDIYTNWGKQNCAGSDQILYFGYGFGSYYDFSGGADNPICINLPIDMSPPFQISEPHADGLYPLVTGDTNDIPFSDVVSTIGRQNFVKCAVCYRQKSACFVNFGTWNCNSPGFNKKIYDGYIMGAPNNTGNNTNSRECINRNFSSSPSPDFGSIMSGSKIVNSFGIAGYNINTNKFAKCSICCN